MRHSVFGVGTVIDVNLQKGAHIVKFDDMSTQRSISFKARLEALSQ